ncbi:UvrD-helicase domain-containing protein [Paenibacillus terrigena]|uniref:UvrD-helicase domain-containing protein n=1 Tax=Paenibacillus terrigena TaxID=369333 RepID=UPI0003704937|nr:UvrD-helicase domain-containing protein [Paenibacillus terrigena]
MTTNEGNLRKNALVWDSFLKWSASSKSIVQATISYEADKILHNVTLTQKQVEIVLSKSKHMLIRGAAGSGKSLALLSRMVGRMIEEDKGRYLYVSYNNKLVQDMSHRSKRSPYYKEMDAKHEKYDNIHFFTFHDLVKRVLNDAGITIPRFETTPQELRRRNDMMIRQMHRVLQCLDSEEFRDLPPIHKIKKEQNVDFLRDEFLWMKANNYITEERYTDRNLERTGRGNLPSISREQRRTIFRLFEKYREDQVHAFHNRLDAEDYALKLIELIDQIPSSLKYDHVFIDEAQDLQPMQLFALTLLTRKSLTICGDDKQRIYKSSPYSYRKLGIEIDRGNNYMLEGIFRSTRQIMALANALQFTREDDDKQEQEIYNKEGSKPRIVHFKNYKDEIDYLVEEILCLKKKNPEESVAVVHRIKDEIQEKDLKTRLGRHFSIKKTDDPSAVGSGSHVYVTDAHPIKGLEFDHVFIINFDRKNYPLQDEFKALEKYNADDVTTKMYLDDKRQIMDREKRVLYVVLTRAKKTLTLMYYGNFFQDVSPFKSDFYPNDFLHESR